MKFEGIYTPIITPLGDQGFVDTDALSRQINRLLANGIQGLYLLGTSGEFASLDKNNRQVVIETAVETVRQRVPIICGAMDTSTQRVISNIKMAECLGITAVTTTPPYYYPSSDQELLTFYREVAVSSNLPVVMYNIPSMVKTNLKPELVAEIVNQNPNIVGIKDSTADWTTFLKLHSYLGNRDNFSILIGSYTMAGAAIVFGAQGAVISISNIDPKTSVELYRAARDRHLNKLQDLQGKLIDLGRLYSYGNGISCLKACAEILGICSSHTTSPIASVSEEAKDELAELLRSHQLL